MRARTMLEEQRRRPRATTFPKSKAVLPERQGTVCWKGDPQLSMENLAHVIELWTKIPAAKIREQFQRLSQLEVRLKSHIIGQTRSCPPWPPPRCGGTG